MAFKAAAAAPSGGGLDQSELKRYPGYFFARARYIAFKHFERNVGTVYQLRPVEFSVLLLLRGNRNVTQSQLSQAMGVAPSNMTGILRRLASRGLIERTRTEADKRVQFVALSKSGAVLIDQAHGIGRTMDKPWLDRLSGAEQAMLMELLGKLSLSVAE